MIFSNKQPAKQCNDNILKINNLNILNSYRDPKSGYSNIIVYASMND